MTSLDALRELQAMHDQLRAIERDLSAFPPDMARLHQDLQTGEKRCADLEKSIEDAKTREAVLSRQLVDARKHEEQARKAVKAAQSKVQYTAAIRELDEKERTSTTLSKPLKDVMTRLEAMQQELTTLRAHVAAAREQFEGLHQIFLSEHENQVAAQGILTTRRQELEGGMDPQELVRFNRILAARQGKAIVAVDGTTCTGCRTKLRIPFMAELREKGIGLCESCQRFIYLSPKA